MRTAIVGGGVAGLATAIALVQRDHPFDVAVYEKHESMTEIGAGVVCWPNACFVLDRLGLLQDIRAVSRRVGRMERQTESGDVLGSLDIGQLDQRMGYPSLAVLRRDLMRILVARLAALGTEVRYGHEVARIEPTKGAARVLLADGSTVDADLIVGADGRMSSVARAFVRGDERPVYQGFLNWIGIFEGEDPLFPQATVKDLWGAGERFGIVPVSGSTAYWAGGVAAPEVGSRSPASYKSELEEIFDSWPEPIPTLVRETETSAINKIYVHDHDPIERWHRDNVLLIGDAAHAALPTSGQGACQALEDAWHLERCLARHGPDLESVFEELTELRYSKTTGITLGARRLAASLFETDPEACAQRNAASKATDYEATVAGMARAWASGLPIGE